MSRESFERGFAKVAQAYGIEPMSLAEFIRSRGAPKRTLSPVPPQKKPVINRVQARPLGFGARSPLPAAKTQTIDYNGALARRLLPKAGLDGQVVGAAPAKPTAPAADFAKWLKKQPAAKIDTKGSTGI